MQALTSPLAGHYDVAGPLLEKLFGPIPLVWVSVPPHSRPIYHGPLSVKTPDGVPHVDVTTCSGAHRYAALTAEQIAHLRAHGAVELHSWSPTRDDPLHAAFGRLLIGAGGGATRATVKEAALALRATLAEDGIECIPIFDGRKGIALWIPFADAPDYPRVRAWLHERCNVAVARHPDLVTLLPNGCRGTQAHLHIASNAPGRFSALPYSARASAGYPLAVPIAWPQFAAFDNGLVFAGELPAWLAQHGDAIATELATIGTQTLGARGAPPAGGPRPITPVAHAETPSVRGSILPAAFEILQDGLSHSADDIYAIALARKLVVPSTTKKYVYTSLIEYIARANGNGRRPAIVQNADRTFRINEPADGWPNPAAWPTPATAHKPPSADVQRRIDELQRSATSADAEAFEVAVCDAFDALGFTAVHLGGQKAPDGYADAQLGPLGFRVMIECKTGSYNVTHPNTFEAAKYRDPYGAQFCALVGSTFGNEIELVKELQTHRVSAWTVADLQTLLRAGSDAFEMRACFAPGFAADGVADLLWARAHGTAKRVSYCAQVIVRVGRQTQAAIAGKGDATAAPRMTLDVATYAIDNELAAANANVTCAREDVIAAFDYLTGPLVGIAAWSDPARESIVIRPC